jgi:serine/threonine protein phosphatase PrpC
MERIAIFKSSPMESLTELIEETNSVLNTTSTIETSISGTTAVLVYFDFQDLYVANVGDSRCVLGTA